MKNILQISGDRKAVVEIPYNKLTNLQQNVKPNPQSPCCESKIIVSSSGSKRGLSNIDLKKMVQEMEEAYDKEIKQMQGIIVKRQIQLEGLKNKFNLEKSQILDNFNTKIRNYEKQIKQLKEICQKKDSQIQKISEQKQIIVRSKISQFRQSEYINRLNEQEHIIRLKDLQIKQLLSKLELFQIQNLKNDEKFSETQLKLQSQLNRISSLLSQTSFKLSAQQSKFIYLSKNHEDQIDKYKIQLQQLERSLRESQNSNETKIKQIALINEKIVQFETNKKRQQNEYLDLKIILNKIDVQRQQLQNKLKDTIFLIQTLENQKSGFISEIGKNYAEIGRLSKELQSKQRVYEVKIERVIDGKQQIDQLQLAIFELEQQLKKLNEDKIYLGEDLQKLRQQNDKLNKAKIKLEIQIGELKSYINKKQSSFRWIVEREIGKDMAISDQIPQIYKVCQFKQYSREIKNEVNKTIQKQIAINFQKEFLNQYSDQIDIQNIR